MINDDLNVFKNANFNYRWKKDRERESSIILPIILWVSLFSMCWQTSSWYVRYAAEGYTCVRPKFTLLQTGILISWRIIEKSMHFFLNSAYNLMARTTYVNRMPFFVVFVWVIFLFFLQCKMILKRALEVQGYYLATDCNWSIYALT